MTVSEEGTAHSDYLFRRDKQLKDGYTMSQKNYRIVPEISKLKSKLVDKEQNISAKIVTQQQPDVQPSDHHSGVSAKEASVRNSSEHNLNGNIVKFDSSNGEYELLLKDINSNTVKITNNNGEYEITFNDEVFYPKECPPGDAKQNKKGIRRVITSIVVLIVFFCISAAIVAYVLKTRSIS